MTVDAVGGVWQHACELSTALQPLGVEAVLALLGPSPTEAQRHDLDDAVALVETGLELDWLAPDAERVERAGQAIASLAESCNVDLVHLNHPAIAASASFVMPVVTTIHSCVATWWQAVYGGEAPPSFVWQTALVSRGLRRSAAVVAPTLSFAEAVRRMYALKYAPVAVANGLWPPSLGLSSRQDSVFTAGRLWDKGKNVATLDRVAARLSCPFDAAGSLHSPHGESIELRHIKALGSLSRAALAARFAKRPVYVSAALYEPFGLAVLEAASAGCALVLSDIPTFRETWDGAATFVEPLDEDGFVEAIDTLLGDGEKRALLETHARDCAVQFTPAQTAAGMHEIYARALAGSGAPMEAARA